MLAKLTLRSISANKGRLSLTMLSIIFGVAFVSGSFILADSLRSVFSELSADIYSGIDVIARGDGEENEFGDYPLFSEDDVQNLVSVEGVGDYEASLSATFQVFSIDANGEVLQPQGPPTIAASWDGETDFSQATLAAGEAPGPGQVLLDPLQIDAGGFEVGDTVRITGPLGADEYELSGIIDFGESAVGAYFLIFDLPTIQNLLGQPGMVNQLSVAAASGTSGAELLENMTAAAPSGVEVISSQTAQDETNEAFGEFIDIFGNVLLGFALVTLFVSIFIIYNTFGILVSQRTKQTGLMRAIGATGSQVRTMVLMESFLVGVVASIIGLFAGIGVAAFLKFLFSQGGGGFPDGPLQIKPRTVIVVMIVGVLVTMLSAIAPAYRASRISPLEALRDVGTGKRSLRFRIVAGASVLIPGIILLALGLAGTTGSTQGVLSLLGFGSILVFIGVAMLSALFAGPVASVIGAPVQRLRGTMGRLARDNASRNPQRTAATATALMIGLSLITAVTVLGASIKDSFTSLLEEALVADVIITSNSELGFTPLVIDGLAALPEVGGVSGFIQFDADIAAGDTTIDDVNVAAFDSSTDTSVVNYVMVEGSIAVGNSGIAVVDETATTEGLSVGDTVNVIIEGTTVPLTVSGIYEPNALTDANWIVDRAMAASFLDSDALDFAALTYADGVDPAAGRAAVDSVMSNFPQLNVSDQTEFQDDANAQIDALLLVINGLLGLCLIIAFFGIVNTMALSVLERTREIGLLRAIGMNRSQLRTSVRWEAVIVSIFGAILGIGMGVILAWAGISALPDEFISSPTIPWGTIVSYVVIAALLGVVAAFFPARRASKLNILDAIATTG